MQCFRQADVCFVIDSSGSICGSNHVGSSCDNWSLLLSFVNTIIDAFTIGEKQTRVGVVTFSNDATLKFGLNQFLDKDDLKRSVSSMRHTGGSTNTGKALHVARTQCFSTKRGERRSAPKISIIITDGLPTIIEYDVSDEAASLKKISTVLAVGVTNSVEKQLLRDISSEPQKENESYFATPDFITLGSIVKTLVTETCQAKKQPLSKPKSGKYAFSAQLIQLKVLCYLFAYLLQADSVNSF